MEIVNSNVIISPNIKVLPRFSPKIRLGVLASGKGTNFESIIQDINNNKLDAEVKCLIVNKPNAEVIKKAKKYSIPYIILNHINYTERESLDEDIILNMKKYNVELIVMAGWMRIVTNKLIEEFNHRIINIHPSILPSFKGIDAIQQSIDNESKITGCTVHIVEEKLDSGRILVQAALPINSNDTALLLQKRVQHYEHIILSIGIILAADELRK